MQTVYFVIVHNHCKALFFQGCTLQHLFASSHLVVSFNSNLRLTNDNVQNVFY